MENEMETTIQWLKVSQVQQAPGITENVGVIGRMGKEKETRH